MARRKNTDFGRRGMGNADKLYQGKQGEPKGISVPERVSEADRIKLLQEKGFRIPPGTSVEEINAMVNKIMDENPSTRSGTIELPPGSIPSPSEGKSAALDFSDALMRGNPVATDALAKALAESKRDKVASLADQFMADSFTLTKRLGLRAHQAKKIEPIVESYRNDLRRAHRFVLDNDFVRYATEISSTMSPQKLLTRLQFATLPYDTTWIEFDLKVKVRTMRTVHGIMDHPFNWNEVADRLGLLIRRTSDTTAVVEIICETFGEHGLIGTTICYFFSLDDHDWTLRDSFGGCKPLVFAEAIRQAIKDGVASEEVQRLVNDDQLMSVGAGSLWGYSTVGESMMIEKMIQMKDLALPVFLMRHGVLGTGRMKEIIETLLKKDRTNEKEVMGSITQLLLNETTEFTGMMRWIVIVLACLNEVPILTTHVAPHGHMRVGLTGRRRYLDYHRVTLRVPKTRPVQYIENKLRNSTRRHRAHEVIAHWRNYLHEVHCKADDHTWEYDYHEGYRLCGKCMAFSRFIREHVRGDPNLGWVKKEYIIKKEQ